jgi:uncharacterized protein YuzE
MSHENILLKYEYDSSYDVLYMQAIYSKSPIAVPLNDDIILDFNEKGKFVGLEILNLSHILKVNKKSLENPINVNLIVKVTESEIFVNIIFNLSVKKGSVIKVTNAIVANDIHLPVIDKELAIA